MKQTKAQLEQRNIQLEGYNKGLANERDTLLQKERILTDLVKKKENRLFALCMSLEQLKTNIDNIITISKM